MTGAPGSTSGSTHKASTEFGLTSEKKAYTTTAGTGGEEGGRSGEGGGVGGGEEGGASNKLVAALHGNKQGRFGSDANKIQTTLLGTRLP